MAAGRVRDRERTGLHLDVVFAADPRFPGGTSTATLMDMRAVRGMNLTAGLLPVRSASLSSHRSYHPRLRAGMEAAGIVPLRPDSAVECDLLLVEHPTLFQHMADRPTAIRPRAAVLVANHPPRMGGIVPEYDLAVILDNIERLFGADAYVAPVSPVVRDLVVDTGIRSDRITVCDLARMVDPVEWAMPIRPPRPGRPIVIGRHGRPDPMKWPDTAEEILAAYPARDDVRVHILGGGPPEELIAHWPAGWRVQPFTTGHPRAFLEDVDFYVYLHSRHWIEAFGMAVLEAMAAGKVVILQPSFRRLFGDGAVYAAPDEVMPAVERFRADPAAYVAQATRARTVAVESFSTAVFAEQFGRIRRQLGIDAPRRVPPVIAAATPPAPAPRQRILFVSSNGVGLGHITRLAAIARRLPPHAEPAFFTLSQGAALLRGLGFNADFVPSHQTRGFDGDSWNRALAQEFAAALEYHQPDAVVFDGSVPYAGLVEVLGARPPLSSFWIRRGLWRPGQSEPALQRGRSFTAVIEPGDLAGREDVGPTMALRGQAVQVPPILLHDPADALDRAAARAALRLPPEGRVVGVQLGIQGDVELAALRTALVERLIERHDCTVVEIRSPLAPGNGAADLRRGLLRRSLYPLARHVGAFDLMITESGYNSFHEMVFSGTPTIFVPRDSPGMDDQTLRARYAVSAGLGFSLVQHETARLDPLLERALDPATAGEIRRRSTRLGFVNGAAEAARFITETSAMLRADRPLGLAVNR